ncbi:hypothetical protein KRX54_06550 [Actinomycetaceae bacterium TAE3-ERU4]|nr:hypothetical protein [Actinomycetaceae bacterium TAE3-ERU4]
MSLRFESSYVSASVPAVFAGLGSLGGLPESGFGLGIALEARTRVRARAIVGESEVIVTDGKRTTRFGEEHVVLRAIRQLLEALEAPQPGFRIELNHGFALSRGFGDQAVEIACAITILRALITPAELLDDSFCARCTADLIDTFGPVKTALDGGIIGYQNGEYVSYSSPESKAENMCFTCFVPRFEVSLAGVKNALVHADFSALEVSQLISKATYLGFSLGNDNGALSSSILAEDLYVRDILREHCGASVAMIDWLSQLGYGAFMPGFGATVAVMGKLEETVLADAREAGWAVEVFEISLTGAQIVTVS